MISDAEEPHHVAGKQRQRGAGDDEAGGHPEQPARSADDAVIEPTVGGGDAYRQNRRRYRVAGGGQTGAGADQASTANAGGVGYQGRQSHDGQ